MVISPVHTGDRQCRTWKIGLCVNYVCELGPGTTGREVRILRLPFCVVQNLCKVRRFHSCSCYVFYCYFDAKIFELNRNSYSRAGEFWCILLMLSWRVSWYSSHGHWWSRRTWCCAGWHGINVIKCLVFRLITHCSRDHMNRYDPVHEACFTFSDDSRRHFIWINQCVS